MDLIFTLLGFFHYQIKSPFFIVFPNAIPCDMFRMNGIVIVLIIFLILVVLFGFFYPNLVPLFTTFKITVMPFIVYTSAYIPNIHMYMHKNFYTYTIHLKLILSFIRQKYSKSK